MNTSKPIKIKKYSRKTKPAKDFEEREWAKANREHYGKEVRFDKKRLYYQAIDTSNEIFGTINLEITGNVCYISSLIVSSTSRRTGIGRLLMEKAEDAAQKENCHKIWLTTGDGWESVQFYRGLGYSQTGKLCDHYFKKDFVIFEKTIS